MQIADEVLEGSADEVPEGSGADGFPEFWCRLLMKFWRVPAQMADEVPEGSGANG